MNIEVRKPTESEIAEAKNWPIWSKEISIFDWEYNEPETCLIIEGQAEVADKAGNLVKFEAGDLVIFPAGLKCIWKIISPIKKHYKFG